MRTYSREKSLPPQPPIAVVRSLPAPKPEAVDALAISPDTPLIDVRTLIDRLKTEKGLRYTSAHIHELCRTGKWVRGTHWTQPGKQRVFNWMAICYWIAQQ